MPFVNVRCWFVTWQFGSLATTLHKFWINTRACWPAAQGKTKEERKPIFSASLCISLYSGWFTIKALAHYWIEKQWRWMYSMEQLHNKRRHKKRLLWKTGMSFLEFTVPRGEKERVGYKQEITEGSLSSAWVVWVIPWSNAALSLIRNRKRKINLGDRSYLKGVFMIGIVKETGSSLANELIKPLTAGFKRSGNNYCLSKKGSNISTQCQSQIRLQTSQGKLQRVSQLSDLIKWRKRKKTFTVYTPGS